MELEIEEEIDDEMELEMLELGLLEIDEEIEEAAAGANEAITIT